MKKLYGSFAAKLIAVILLCVLALGFTLSFIGTVQVYGGNGFSSGYQNFLYRMVGNKAEGMINEIGWSITRGTKPENASHYSGLQIRVLDGRGQELYEAHAQLLRILESKDESDLNENVRKTYFVNEFIESKEAEKKIPQDQS